MLFSTIGKARERRKTTGRGEEWFGLGFFFLYQMQFYFCVKNLWSPSFNIYKVNVLVINY